MMTSNLIGRLGIQSWCFRKITDNSKVIEALKECGVDHIELCGIHINPCENAKSVVSQYLDAGITISAFGVNGFNSDMDAARKVFELAELAGFPTISADFATGGIEVVEKLCDEYGKKVAFHNHGRLYPVNSPHHIEEMFGKTTPNVGLCLDTAWMLDSGYDPIEVAEKFQDRLYGIHIKDFIFDRAGNPEDVVVGTGNLDLKRLACFLDKIDFSGYITLEYEGDEDNPVPALKKCVENIKGAFEK